MLLTYHEENGQGAADRAFEIEITPEMIEAGVNAVDPYDAELLTFHEQVKLILKAALSRCSNCVVRGVE